MKTQRVAGRLKDTAGPLAPDGTITVIKKTVGVVRMFGGCSHPFYDTMLELKPNGSVQPSIVKAMVKQLQAMGWTANGKAVYYKDPVGSKQLTFELEFQDDESEENDGAVPPTRYMNLLYLSAARMIWLG